MLTLAMIIVSNRNKDVSCKGATLPYIETHYLLPADGWGPNTPSVLIICLSGLLLLLPSLNGSLMSISLFC